MSESVKDVIKRRSSDLVTMNVNGTKFDVTERTFQAMTKAAKLEGSAHLTQNGEYYFDRHVPSFREILNFFQRGELHLPDGVCHNVYTRELKFWGLENNKLEDCCDRKLSAFLDDEQLLGVFRGNINKVQSKKDNSFRLGFLSNIRWRVWCLLDDPKSSKWAKGYMAVSIIFVLISVFVVTASTHPSFTRELSTVEFTKLYRNEFGVPPPGFFRKLPSKNKESPPRTSNSSTSGNDSSLRPPGPRRPGEMFATTTETPTLNNFRARQDYLTYMEYIAMAFFTLDFLLRLLTCPNLCVFTRVINICDVLALLSMYTKLAVDLLLPEERYSISLFDFMECLQIARMFRFFRILKDVMGFRVLVYTIRTSKKEMALLMMYLALCVVLFASLVYYCERDNMLSVPDAMWWVVITMTTVGYGDMAPKSYLGKIIGCLASICGVILLAVTIPVFLNNFILFYNYSKSVDSKKKLVGEEKPNGRSYKLNAVKVEPIRG